MHLSKTVFALCLSLSSLSLARRLSTESDSLVVPVATNQQATGLPTCATTPRNSRIDELQTSTDEYYSAKYKAIGFGITGMVVEVVGGVIYVQGGGVIVSTSSNGDASVNTTAVVGELIALASIPFDVLAIVNTVRAIVKGNQLREYEEGAGCRISVVPVVQPRTGGVGALARLEF